MKERLNIDKLEIGDQVIIEYSTGDRMKGGRITGTVKTLTPSHRQVQLNTGWCGHDGDYLIEHKRVSPAYE